MTTTRPRTTARRTALAAAIAVAGLGGLALPATSGAACPTGGDPDIANCPNNNQTPPSTKARGTVSVNPSTTLGVRYVPVQRSKQFRQLKNGATVRIICQTRGSKVSGTFGTTRIWDKLKGGGYVSDAYVNTGSDRRVAPSC